MKENIKIGITERGDAGINFEWKNKINSVHGAILITKNLNDFFIQEVLKQEKPIIIHCTCTGYGGTKLEPNVPNFNWQLNQLKKLINFGFPAEKCVLRIDPIYPTQKGLIILDKVIQYFQSLNTGISRIRISLVDEYNHVKNRYKTMGWNPIYKGFNPSQEQIKMVADKLMEYPFLFETCAEDKLNLYGENIIARGCISIQDLKLMEIPTQNFFTNPQGRNGCHCLSCKTELLSNKARCPHGCIYCYWK